MKLDPTKAKAEENGKKGVLYETKLKESHTHTQNMFIYHIEIHKIQNNACNLFTALFGLSFPSYCAGEVSIHNFMW